MVAIGVLSNGLFLVIRITAEYIGDAESSSYRDLLDDIYANVRILGTHHKLA